MGEQGRPLGPWTSTTACVWRRSWGCRQLCAWLPQSATLSGTWARCTGAPRRPCGVADADVAEVPGASAVMIARGAWRVTLARARRRSPRGCALTRVATPFRCARYQACHSARERATVSRQSMSERQSTTRFPRSCASFPAHLGAHVAGQFRTGCLGHRSVSTSCPPIGGARAIVGAVSAKLRPTSTKSRRTWPDNGHRFHTLTRYADSLDRAKFGESVMLTCSAPPPDIPQLHDIGPWVRAGRQRCDARRGTWAALHFECICRLRLAVLTFPPPSSVVMLGRFAHALRANVLRQ